MEVFSPPFNDRREAGALLAKAVRKHALEQPILILGLPRGGVSVAYEVARELCAPLDAMVVRKIGMPGQPELAIGAIAGQTIVRDTGSPAVVNTKTFEKLVQREQAELRRRERAYRRGLPPLDLKGRTVLLVDDGLATGCTMIAAVREARRLHASAVVAASPITSDSAEALVRAEADALITLKVAVSLSSVGAWYFDFDQVSDSEVCDFLQLTPHRNAEPARSS
jgi:putative phosphoribosyl transferase